MIVSDAHFRYLDLIDKHYKAGDLEKAEEYCKKDISIFQDFKREIVEEYGHFGLFVPSFVKLAIIYEKQGKVSDAIDVCKLALSKGQEDGTKGGFKGRIERLKKKLQQQTVP